ncbi:MAG: glycosyltransferase family 2 protein [Candidatus Eisenbacteria bacterium]
MDGAPLNQRTLPPISAVVITRDEEANLERCLLSARAVAAELVVVDSGSTDRTLDIARRLADVVLERPWLGYGPQKQFALDQARHDWVLALDADEVLTPALASEIGACPFDLDGYELPRRSWYLGRWILHGTWYPDPVLRLFRRDRARYTTDRVHESVQLAGTLGRFRGHLDHYPYKDLAHHMAKLDALATLAAAQLAERGKRASWTRLALKPPFEFLRSYVLRRGFLDGAPGLVAAGMHAHYNFLKYAKLVERTRG